MDYFFHSYPKELAKQIVSRWGPASDVFDTLPPEDALASFLSEAYQASLLREEDRSIICRPFSSIRLNSVTKLDHRMDYMS